MNKSVTPIKSKKSGKIDLNSFIEGEKNPKKIGKGMINKI